MKLNPLAWFRREVKQSAAGPAISAFSVGRPVWTKRNYEGFAREAYGINAVAHRCVKLIAQSCASPPWLLYDKGGVEIEEHPLLDLLNKPNPMNGGAQFWEAFYAYLMLAGNSYIEHVQARGKASPELWALRPDRMQVIPGQYGTPQAYRYEVNGRQIDWDVDPRTGRSAVLHVREFNPCDDWYGLSRVEPAAYGVDRHNAAAAHNKALLDNGARPSGALVFKPISAGTGEPSQSAPAEVLKAAEDRLQERYGGPDNAGRPMVLGGNVEWEEMGLSPKDMDFGKNKDDAGRDIATSFGVPHILIVPGEATYNNLREARLWFWEDTVLPLINTGLDALNTWLAPEYDGDLKIAVDLDDIPALEPRREAKRTSVTLLFDKGLLTRDEAREALQYDDWPEDAVGKVDAPVLTAVIESIDKIGVEPAERYLQSTGLYPEGQTIADAVASLPDELTGMDNPEDVAAAMTPQGDGGPSGQEQNDGAEDRPLTAGKALILGWHHEPEPHPAIAHLETIVDNGGKTAAAINDLVKVLEENGRPIVNVEPAVINVAPANIEVHTPPVNVDVKVSKRGDVVKEVTGYDDRGRIIAMTEREIEPEQVEE